MTKNTSNHIMNIYRWNYLTQTLLSVFISTYLPVILGEVRNFDAKEISFIVLGQIPLLFKPLLGFLSERRIEEKIERKDSINKHAVTKSRKTLITGGISLYIIAISILSFVVYSTSFIFIFIILFFAHTGQAISDMAADTIVLDHRSNQKKKYGASANKEVFSILGLPISTLLYSALVSSDLQSGWNYFILILATIAIPTLWFGKKYKYEISEKSENRQSSEKNREEEENKLEATLNNTTKNSIKHPKKNSKKYLKRSRILLIPLMIFLNGSGLIDMLNEPYLIGKFGENAFDLYTTYFSFAMIGSLPVIYLLYKYRRTIAPYRNYIIAGGGLFFILYYYLLNFGSLAQILVSIIFLSPIEHTVNFVFITLLMDLTPWKRRAMWYQVFALIYAGANIGFRSLGPIISNEIGFGWTSFATVMILTMNIPVLLAMKLQELETIPGIYIGRI